MKCLKQIMIMLTACLGLSLSNAQADVAFSAGISIQARTDFYEPLTPYGAWVDVGSYGRCWHPARVETGWRPYCEGHWEWTDCGWYWVSDEPWAWACYHYGRWTIDPHYGWVWIPDVEWAPAWVNWREGGDYIGWAPCPPTGISIAPAWFVFVGAGHFHDPIRPSTVIVNNTTIINRTKLITDIKRDTRVINGTRQRVIINQGPGVDPVQRATGKKFNPVPIHEAVRQTPVPSNVRHETLPPTGREQNRPAAVQEQPRTATPREKAPVVAEPPREQHPVTEQPHERQREGERVAPTPAPTPVIPRETPRETPPPQTGREKERIYEQERKAPPSERVVPAPQRPAPEPEKAKGREHEKEKEKP